MRSRVHGDMRYINPLLISMGVIVGGAVLVVLIATLYRRLNGRTPKALKAILPTHNDEFEPTQKKVLTRKSLATLPLAEDDSSRVCLMCKSAPKNGRHDFCGEECRRTATSSTPLLLPIPQGHVTFKLVESEFKSAWSDPRSSPCPTVRSIFKIIESDASREQYEAYRKIHRNECIRYHGTGRTCSLGSVGGNQYPCWSTKCQACRIIRTSFQIQYSRPASSLSLGRGIYTTSAANKAATFCRGSGTIFMARVVLGRACHVRRHQAVKSCPPGYDSVVFNKMSGRLNETVVYTNDAIRPVYMIVFG